MGVDTGSAMYDAQVTMFSQLTQSAALRQVVTGVFNGNAPTNQPLPYVSFSGKTESPHRTFSSPQDKQLVVMLDIYSAKQSDEEVSKILGVVNSILDGKTFTSRLFQHVVLYETGAPLYDSESKIHTLPAQYRVYSSVL